jgi:hypothetical protein
MKKINNFVTTNLYLIKLKLDWLEMLRNIVKIRLSDSKMCPLINEFNVSLGGRRLPMGADIFVMIGVVYPLTTSGCCQNKYTRASAVYYYNISRFKFMHLALHSSKVFGVKILLFR